MSMSEVIVRQRQKGGKGGLFGKIAGTIAGGIAGAIAAPFTGGASLAAIPALASAGGAVGGMAGGVADPGKVTEGRKIGTIQSQMDVNPEVGVLALNDGLRALDFLPPGPDVDQQRSTMTEALSVLKRRVPNGSV